MNLPINPKETAQAAIARGELWAGDFGPTKVYDTALSDVQHDFVLGFYHQHGRFPEMEEIPKVKLPAEIGLAKHPPTPKPETPHLLRHAPRKAGNRKYIITPKQAKELGYKLP